MGRNPEQNRILRDVQQAKILSVSLDLFVRRGFAATRIADIATEAGVSAGLLYHYFPSKDDVLVALLRESLCRMEASAEALESIDQPVSDTLRMAVQQLINDIREHSETGKFHLLVAQVSASDMLPEAARSIIESHTEGPYRVMERLLAKGQREGSVRDGAPNEMATIFWALVKGLSIHHAVHGRKMGIPTPDALLPLFLK